MGLVIHTAGSRFENRGLPFRPPVADGLLYWGFLNDSVDRLGRNYAPDGDPISVVGVPTVTSKGAVLSGTNHVQTGVKQTSAFTLIVAGNPVVDGAEAGMFISNYTSARASGVAGTSFGVSLYAGGDDTAVGTFGPRLNVSSYSGIANAPSNLNNAILPATDITKPAFLVGTFDSVDKIVKLRNLSAGTSAQSSAFTEAVDMGVAPFKIGASPLASYTNRAKNFHFAAIYNRRLSDSEIGLIYTRMKRYLATRGIIV